MVIFTYLLKNIYAELIKTKPSLKQIFIDKLYTKLNGMNTANKQAIGNLLTGYGNYDFEITMDQQKNTIHSIYAILCEYIGAPSTDKLFSRIFKAAEELPEAITEKPKQWL